MFVKAFEEMLFKSQAFDRWSLLSPCLPRGCVFSGLVTMYGPGSTRILEKKKGKRSVFSNIRMDPGSYIVTSPDNTYPRGKHGEIKVHRSNACGLNVFQTSFMLDLLSICFCRYIRCHRVGFW